MRVCYGTLLIATTTTMMIWKTASLMVHPSASFRGRLIGSGKSSSFSPSVMGITRMACFGSATVTDAQGRCWGARNRHCAFSTSRTIRTDISMWSRSSRKRRRRSQNSDEGTRPKVPVVMQQPVGGIPEIAQVYPEMYEELLEEKVEKLEQMIRQAFNMSNGGNNEGKDATSTNIPSLGNNHQQQPPPTEIFRSPREGFRMRANFKIWKSRNTTNSNSANGGNDQNEQEHEQKEEKEKEKGSLHYVMFERGDNKTPHEVHKYPMGYPTIQKLMDPLMSAIRETNELSEKINDVRFLTSLKGDALISITYNRPIGDEWVDAAKELVQQLRTDNIHNGTVKFVGRSRKVKLVVGSDTIEETLRVHDRQLHYVQTEGSFSQPNAIVCQKMLEWACDATKIDNDDSGIKGTKHDLCELYCGNGCFTVALAPNFRFVAATEMSKSSVALAQQNLVANNVTNTKVAKLSAEDFVNAYHGRRQFRRLENAGMRIEGKKTKNSIEIDNDNNIDSTNNISNNNEGYESAEGGNDSTDIILFDRLQTLFVDPPRAGLDETCRKLASEFNRVVYVSCNPETLARDLSMLAHTHDLKSVAAFDQFPYTPHLEAGVVLERRKNDSNSNKN